MCVRERVCESVCVCEREREREREREYKATAFLLCVEIMRVTGEEGWPIRR